MSNARPNKPKRMSLMTQTLREVLAEIIDLSHQETISALMALQLIREAAREALVQPPTEPVARVHIDEDDIEWIQLGPLTDGDLLYPAGAPSREASAQASVGEVRWIPVTERLPDLELPVWCAFPAGDIIICARAETGDGWLWGQCYGRPFYDGEQWVIADCEQDDEYLPTHWMPLPEPPQVAELPEPSQMASGNQSERSA